MQVVPSSSVQKERQGPRKARVARLRVTARYSRPLARYYQSRASKREPAGRLPRRGRGLRGFSAPSTVLPHCFWKLKVNAFAFRCKLPHSKSSCAGPALSWLTGFLIITKYCFNKGTAFPGGWRERDSPTKMTGVLARLVSV